jgi:hypothetical protein
MFRFLRRYQPKPVALAVLYWAVLTLLALAGLFAIFTVVDGILPGAGMF